MARKNEPKVEAVVKATTAVAEATAEAPKKAKKAQKRSTEWMARSRDRKRPEVEAALVNGGTPNTPLEGPGIAPFVPPYRSANAWNPPLEGPALAPFAPPVRS